MYSLFLGEFDNFDHFIEVLNDKHSDGSRTYLFLLFTLELHIKNHGYATSGDPEGSRIKQEKKPNKEILPQIEILFYFKSEKILIL